MGKTSPGRPSFGVFLLVVRFFPNSIPVKKIFPIDLKCWKGLDGTRNASLQRAVLLTPFTGPDEVLMVCHVFSPIGTPETPGKHGVFGHHHGVFQTFEPGLAELPLGCPRSRELLRMPSLYRGLAQQKVKRKAAELQAQLQLPEGVALVAYKAPVFCFGKALESEAFSGGVEGLLVILFVV